MPSKKQVSKGLGSIRESTIFEGSLMSVNAIELRDIYKSFGEIEVLHNVSLSIPKGKIMAIVGPSGAGKTTLLQIAGTLDYPDRGEVVYGSVNPFLLKDRKLSSFRNKNIGFIFQFHQLLPEFNAIENVAMPALIAGIARKKAFAEAETLLEELGMGHRLHHKPAELSGGEKQRVAIARALVNKPGIVFADEPTGSLDSHNREEIQNIIVELNRRHSQTFVIVTHDPEMSSISDITVTIEDGRIKSTSFRNPEIDELRDVADVILTDD